MRAIPGFHLRGRSAALVTVALLGCGGTSNTMPPPPPPPVSYAGTYTTRVSLVQNGCGTVAVQDNPTTVTHATATGAITLTHAAQAYVGTVLANGAFTTTPKSVNVNDGFLYTIALAGQFGSAGFEADATVDRSDTVGGSCRFVVHWTASR